MKIYFNLFLYNVHFYLTIFKYATVTGDSFRQMVYRYFAAFFDCWEIVFVRCVNNNCETEVFKQMFNDVEYMNYSIEILN